MKGGFFSSRYLLEDQRIYLFDGSRCAIEYYKRAAGVRYLYSALNHFVLTSLHHLKTIASVLLDLLMAVF